MKQNTPCNCGECPYGAEYSRDCEYHCGGTEPESKYTVSYKGYLFYGDNDGWNFHDYDNWDEVVSLINAYGMEEDLDFSVRHNETDMVWRMGEWG